MKQAEALTPRQQVDIQIALQDVREREKLWHLAEGRLGWRRAAAYLAPFLLLLAAAAQRIGQGGLGAWMRDWMRDGTMYFVFAIVVFGFVMWATTQRQLGALLEIVKRMDRTRS